MSIVDKIEEIREAKRINKKQFASLIGMARDSVYNLSDDVIKVSTLQKISEVLETPIEVFFAELSNKSDIKIIKNPKASYSKNKSHVVLELGSNDIVLVDMKNKRLDITKGG